MSSIDPRIPKRGNALLVCIVQPPLREDNEAPLEAMEVAIRMIREAASKSATAFGDLSDAPRALACEMDLGNSEASAKRFKTSSFQHDNNDSNNHHNTTEKSNPLNQIKLFLLPELSPVGYSEDSFARFLPNTTKNKKMYQTMNDRMKEVAREVNAFICYGTMGWNNEGKSKEHELFIRQVVVNPEGIEVATYDKIHPCDYGDCAETRFFTPGQRATSFSIPTFTTAPKNNNLEEERLGAMTSSLSPDCCSCWKIGIIICSDMRYPQLCQHLVRNHGVDVILQPAAFARDISFRTWRSFRETRAVENGVYYMACNYAGLQYGQSSMTPPWVDEDNEPVLLGTDAGYLLCLLDKKVLQKARTELPFHKHTMSDKWDAARNYT